jgi:hypothetical protein
MERGEEVVGPALPGRPAGEDRARESGIGVHGEPAPLRRAWRRSELRATAIHEAGHAVAVWRHDRRRAVNANWPIGIVACACRKLASSQAAESAVSGWHRSGSSRRSTTPRRPVDEQDDPPTARRCRSCWLCGRGTTAPSAQQRPRAGDRRGSNLKGSKGEISWFGRHPSAV